MMLKGRDLANTNGQAPGPLLPSQEMYPLPPPPREGQKVYPLSPPLALANATRLPKSASLRAVDFQVEGIFLTNYF